MDDLVIVPMRDGPQETEQVSSKIILQPLEKNLPPLPVSSKKWTFRLSIYVMLCAAYDLPLTPCVQRA